MQTCSSDLIRDSVRHRSGPRRRTWEEKQAATSWLAPAYGSDTLGRSALAPEKIWHSSRHPHAHTCSRMEKQCWKMFAAFRRKCRPKASPRVRMDGTVSRRNAHLLVLSDAIHSVGFTEKNSHLSLPSAEKKSESNKHLC